MPLRALIFDLDGTLTESDVHHTAAYIAVMADHGVALDQATYLERMSGRPNLTIIEEFLPHLSHAEALAVIDDKEARFRRLATRLEPLPGLAEVLAWAAEHELALAVVTNAPRENLDFALEALELATTFPVRVSPEEVANAKPDPEPYLLALARLGVSAEEALAFEDSPSGVTSACGAGLRVVGVTTGQPAERLRSHGSLLEIADFRDPSLWELMRGRFGP